MTTCFLQKNRSLAPSAWGAGRGLNTGSAGMQAFLGFFLLPGRGTYGILRADARRHFLTKLWKVVCEIP